MYKAVVADDEKIICESICDFINNNDFGFQVENTFMDGEDLIDFLNKNENKIDLIITDIRMLKVSGLEVAKHVFEQKLKTKIILLSGYKDFEYAKQAMMYNVSNYILKPTDFDELIAALTDIKDTLDAEISNLQISNRYTQFFTENRNEFLSGIIKGMLDDKLEIEKSLKILSRNINDIMNMPSQYLKGMKDEDFLNLMSNIKNDIEFCKKHDARKLLNMKDAKEIKDWCREVINDVLDHSSEDTMSSKTSIVNQAKKFIDENYHKNIALTDVASEVFLSPIYLSRIFKEEIGENFSNYLMKVRMEHAIKLLEQNMKIEKIATKTGYSSSRYFVRMFKQYTAYTPKEYYRKVLKRSD